MSRPLLVSRAARAAALLALVAALPGCSMIGMGKKTISVSLEATDQLNTCGKASAQPLEFAVLQVTDPSAITGTSLVQIWGKEKALYGDALLTRDAGTIVPSSKQPFVYERNAKTKAIVVIGNFCRPDGSCWYFTQPLTKGSKVALKAEAFCLAKASK